ncbi:MAG: dipeptidase [Paludibacteraceae bacterium]
MKRTLVLCALGAWLCNPLAEACTNFIVGKDASSDGSTIISYAADSYSLYGFLRFSPAADYPAGTMREVKDWDTGRPLGQIPQVAHTYSVVGNMNEHQLTIGETTWGGRPELEDTVGIDYGSLIYIALERCKTAREAIRCMTDLVAEYGYASSGETFSIGDPNEVWIMDMIGKGAGRKGAVWVATRVPDDCICAHANQARITNIDFRDKQNWLYSKDVVKFAREKGYFSGKDADFSFQAAYAPFDFSGLYVCEARVWSFFRHFSDDMDRYYDYATGKTFLATGGKDAGTPMPLYIRPNHKVSVQEIKDCMRDQYEGTPLDITQGTDAGPWNTKLRYGSLAFRLDSTTYWYERPTATQQTGWSFVAQMRAYADPKVGGIFWFGVDDAATNVYVPMYCRINHVPECFAEGNGDLYTFSPTSAWWTFNIVANWAYTKYSRMKPEITKLQQILEDKFNTQIAGVDAKAAGLEDTEVREFLTNYSCAQADNVMIDWQNLAIYLLTKYLDGQERKEENGEFKRNAYGEPTGPNRPAFPDSFLRTIQSEVAHE